MTADAVSQPVTEPVTDWTEDYDVFDKGYLADPGPIWADMRERCPVAHTERWGGSWLPTRYEDVRAIAKDVDVFSSQDPVVVQSPPSLDGEGKPIPYSENAPPITSDPPVHNPARRLILPAFSPKAVERHEKYTVELVHELIDGFIDRGRCDGAVDYAEQIPPRIIAHLLGVDPGDANKFTEWVGAALGGAVDPETRVYYRQVIRDFFLQHIRDRRENPRDDFISEMMKGELNGEPVSDKHLVSTCHLMLVAGIDTTQSSIGSALFHFATHPDDRRRLAAEPELLPTATEEILRCYSPVTMARIVTTETEVNGAKMCPGDRVLMSFAAANRDPEAFPDPDTVKIDREVNRHIAFGVGIHRCAGSNLARMEMNVAVGAFISRIPEFELECPEAVTWGGGQVRGPRRLPLRFG